MTPTSVFVLIPAYNVGNFLVEAVESVIAQTFQDWTLLILDDCSTDDTSSVAALFVRKDERITYLKNEQNLGMVNNWNKGITYCKSTYFVKLDADDKWHPDMIESALGILNEHKDVGIVFTKYVNIDQHGSILKTTESTLPDFAKDKSFSCIQLVRQGVSKMLSYPILRQGLSIMRSNIFAEVGVYRFLITADTQASSDTEFYFRVGAHYKIYCINKVMYFYRVHPNSISAINYASGLSAQKIYEVKTVINNYYFEQKIIDEKMWWVNKIETDFAYALFQNYRFRVQAKYLDVLKMSIRLILVYPIRTLRHLMHRLSHDKQQI